MKATEQGQWRRSALFVVNFEDIQLIGVLIVNLEHKFKPGAEFLELVRQN